MGAPHAVHWSKSFVFVLKQVFSYFSVTNGNKERKAVQKHAIKGSLPFRCYSLMLVDTQKLVDSWGKCDFSMFFVILCIFLHFMSEIDRKSCFWVKKIILTSEQRVEHPFVGQNTQHQY